MRLSNKQLYALIAGITILYGVLYWIIGDYIISK